MIAKTLNDLMNSIESKNNSIEESREPEIGIFYIIGNELLIDSVPVREVPAQGGYKVFDKIHKIWWQEIQRELISFKALTKGRNYNYYPRGRVTYIVHEDRYYVLLDKAILKNKKKVDNIVKSFKLPYGKYEIQQDSHYNCLQHQKETT